MKPLANEHAIAVKSSIEYQTDFLLYMVGVKSLQFVDIVSCY